MSVMLPWRREPKPPPGNRAHAQDIPDNRARPTNRSILPRALLALALVCAGVLIGLFTMGRGTKGRALWSQSGATLVSQAGGEYLLRIGTRLSVWGAHGCDYELESQAEQALLTSDGAILLDGSLVVLERSASRKELLTLPQGGFLITPAFDGHFCLASPADGGLYGESWHLGAATTSGETKWQAAVPAVPVIVRHLGKCAFVATLDVASGGESWLYCLDAGSGKRLWSRSLGTGMWRGLMINGESVVVVLNNLARAFSPDGHVLWSLEPPGPITSANGVGASMALAWDPPGESPVGRLASSGVLLLAGDGTVRWRKYVAGRHLRVADIGQPWSGEASVPCIGVLSDSTVTGLSVVDGQEMFRVRMGGHPLDFRDGTVLVQDGRDLRLVAIEDR